MDSDDKRENKLNDDNSSNKSNQMKEEIALIPNANTE